MILKYREYERLMSSHAARQRVFRELPGLAAVFFDSADAAHCEDRAVSTVQRYAEKWAEVSKKGLGLLLWGGLGTGKTHTAACAANALISRGVSVGFHSLAGLIDGMQGLTGERRQGLTESLLSPELLVLDDLGAERDTEWGRERLFEIIDRRVKTGRPMLITTNLDPKNMARADSTAERRIYDRILEVCVPVAFLGENHRLRKAREARAALEDILLG